MSNVIRFCDRAAAFNVNRIREFALKRNASEVFRREAARPVLVAVWRCNPASGRLECCWSNEPSAHLDEVRSRRISPVEAA